MTLRYFIQKHHVAFDCFELFTIQEAPTSVLDQVALLSYVLLVFLNPR
jgi:hypothetical protein